MSHLTDLIVDAPPIIVDALPIARTACVLTAAICRILLARLNTPAGTRLDTTRTARAGAASVAPVSTSPPQHARLSRVVLAAGRSARSTAAIATVLSWQGCCVVG